MKSINRWVGIVVLGLGLFLSLFSLQLPLIVDGVYDSGFMPLITGVFLVIAGIILGLRKDDDTKPDWPSAKGFYSLLVIFGSLLVYAFLMKFLGFLVSTFLYLMVVIRFWGSYSWLFVIVLAVILTGIIHGIFVLFLNVPLP